MGWMVGSRMPFKTTIRHGLPREHGGGQRNDGCRLFRLYELNVAESDRNECTTNVVRNDTAGGVRSIELAIKFPET